MNIFKKLFTSSVSLLEENLELEKKIEELKEENRKLKKNYHKERKVSYKTRTKKNEK